LRVLETLLWLWLNRDESWLLTFSRWLTP
jgi:hypothetical protein